MSQEIGQLRAALSANAARFEQDMSKAKEAVRKNARKMETSMGGVRKGFEGVIKSIKAMAVVGAAAITAISYAAIRVAKDSIRAASDLQETQNKFSVVFKDQMELANDWAETLRNNYLMSEREAKQYLSSMQDLLVPMGMNSKEAAKLSFEIVKLAADLGSFNNLPTAKVMEDIQSALVGNYETMKKYGVVLTATTVQERALATGIAKTKDELTAAQKAQTAYNIIVESSAAAIGDVERSYDSYANQLKKFKANTEDLQALIGEALLPSVTDIIIKINEWVRANEPLLQQKVPEYVERTVNGIKELGKVLEWVAKATTLFETDAEKIERKIKNLNNELAALEKYSADTGAFDAFSNWLNKISGHGTHAEQSAARIAEIREEIAKLQEQLIQSRGGYAQPWGGDIGEPEVTEGIKNQKEEIKKLSKEEEKAAAAINKQIEALQFQSATYGMTAAEITLYRLALAGANEQQILAAKLALEDIAAKKAQAEATQKAAEAQQQLADRGQQLWEQTRTPLERYNETIEELNELLAAGVIKMDVFSRASQQAWEQLQSTAEDTKDTAKETTDYIAELNKQTYSNMQQGLSDLLFNTAKGNFEDFGDWLESFLDTMLRSWTDTLAKMAMQGLLGENLQGGGWLDSLLGSLFGGKGGGAGGGGIIGGLVGAVAGLLHEGGRVGIDTVPMRLVSPEVFAHAPKLHQGLLSDEYPAILKQGEHVLTPEQMAAMERGGGMRPQIVMNITTPDAGSFRASQGQIMRDAGFALRRWAARNG